MQSRRAVWSYLQALRRETGLSLLLTTHQIEEAEDADLVAVIDRGEVLAFGTPQELRASLGGMVVTLRGVPDDLRATLRTDTVGAVMEEAGDTLRLRVPDPAPLLARLAPDLPRLTGLSVQAASLEDVFPVADRPGAAGRARDPPEWPASPPPTAGGSGERAEHRYRHHRPPLLPGVPVRHLVA